MASASCCCRASYFSCQRRLIRNITLSLAWGRAGAGCGFSVICRDGDNGCHFYERREGAISHSSGPICSSSAHLPCFLRASYQTAIHRLTQQDPQLHTQKIPLCLLNDSAQSFKCFKVSRHLMHVSITEIHTSTLSHSWNIVVPFQTFGCIQIQRVSTALNFTLQSCLSKINK